MVVGVVEVVVVDVVVVSGVSGAGPLTTGENVREPAVPSARPAILPDGSLLRTGRLLEAPLFPGTGFDINAAAWAAGHTVLPP